MSKPKREMPSPDGSTPPNYEPEKRQVSPAGLPTPVEVAVKQYPSPDGTAMSYYRAEDRVTSSPDPEALSKAGKPVIEDPVIQTIRRFYPAYYPSLPHPIILDASKAPRPRGPIRVLYVSSNTRVGGAETVLKRLLRGLDKTRVKASVLVTGDRGPLHEEYIQHATVTYARDDKAANLEDYIHGKAVEGRYDYIHFINHWNLYDVIPRIRQSCPDTEIIASLFVNMYHFRQVWAEDIERIKRVTPHLYA